MSSSVFMKFILRERALLKIYFGKLFSGKNMVINNITGDHVWKLVKRNENANELFNNGPTNR